MRVPNQRIEAACSKDETRPAICCVNLMQDADQKWWLEATDSYMLTRLPADELVETDDVPGMIPGRAFVDARKVPGGAGRIMVRESGVQWSQKGGGVASVDKVQGTFPPTISRIITDNIGDNHPVTFRFGVNPELLVKAAKAMGTRDIQVAFTWKVDPHGHLHPMLVSAIEGSQTKKPELIDGMVSVVMPIRLAS